jgi:hypothetical protein
MITNRSKLHSAFAIAALAALFVVGGACGPFHMGTDQRAYLIFANESLDQADVYATGLDGFPIRIGTVFAGRTDTLPVPETVTGQGGSVNISARLLARSGVPQSGLVSIRPGDKLLVRLPSDEKMLVVLP